jgi:hypothetical protein
MLCLERTVGEARIAGPEDDVALEIDVDLLLERLLDVDSRQHAEALSFERFRRPFERPFEGGVEGRAEAVGSALIVVSA